MPAPSPAPAHRPPGRSPSPARPRGAAATPASTVAQRLRRFAFRGAVTQAFCVAIALMLWQLAHGSLRWTLAYSLAIGNCTWLSIDFGMHGVARAFGWSSEVVHARAGWSRLAVMLAVAALGAVVGYSAGTALVDAFSGFRSPSLFDSRGSSIISLLAAVVVTAFFYGRERLAAEQASAEAARRSALENELKLLQSQLEPHMLFNTLANLRVLIGLDPSRAQAMLDHLIAFLRATLNASRASQHPLRTEFDRLADYLALMQVRMGARLQVRFDLPAELGDAAVPPLLLQPLVENAIRHGLEPKLDGGRIEVAARRAADRLVLTVRDTGVGLGATPSHATAAPGTGPAAGTGATGYGTQHVRERLAALFGSHAALHLAPAPDAHGGTLATVELPLPP